MNHVEPYPLKNHVRVVTATSLFDGHDVAINIMRRILQDSEPRSSTWGTTARPPKWWRRRFRRMPKACA